MEEQIFRVYVNTDTFPGNKGRGQPSQLAKTPNDRGNKKVTIAGCSLSFLQVKRRNFFMKQ
jgi:hypothetical protein